MCKFRIEIPLTLLGSGLFSSARMLDLIETYRNILGDAADQ